ncbi:hypothetical protein Tco_0952892 [Tanacetum coccineum]|uniref:Reverse transcriptase domain-containing protein n=1 Tax=Tanacetum coccineum TaxID=301880 RepID=A0ABQ5E0L9_9ASTR
MMTSFFQMNTASTSGSGSLPSNTVANPRGELKAITTQSGLVLDRPSVPMPPPFINPVEDERIEETLTDPELAEYTIKVLPPLVQKDKSTSLKNYVVHQRDPLYPNIPYPSRMHQEKQQEKDEVQIHKFWKMFKQLHINISLADALILIPKYQKMLKSLLSNKEKLLELANTPLNEKCSAVILKKLPEKLRDPGKFLIPCGFSELKCKALANLGARINLMPLSVWKKLISTRMTLELANRAICTPAGIARDIFVLIGKEEMILRDDDERLILNMKHDTSSYSNKPQKELINMIDIYNITHKDYLEDLFANEKITNHLSSNPTPILEPVTKSSFSPTITSFEESDLIWEEFKAYLVSDSFPLGNDDHVDLLLEEFIDELALIKSFPSGNDGMNPEDVIRGIEYLLNHDPLAEYSPNNDLVDTIPEMFTNEHTLDYSSPPLYDDVNDDLVELKFDNDNVYDDPFDSKEDKIKESKLLIGELDPPRSSDFLPSPKCDSVLYEDFSELRAFPSTNTEDKEFNPLYSYMRTIFCIV